MADRAVSAEVVFDRAAASSLALAYRILVPERRTRAKLRSEHAEDEGVSPERPGPTDVGPAEIAGDLLASARTSA